MMPMDLNPTNQKDLYEKACRRMAELVPGWSDEIPSEPTVTILELASQLSDLQNYKWNLVGPEHYLAYLELLGGVRRELKPAVLLTRVVGDADPYPGQRYWVDGVVPLNTWQVHIPKNNRTCRCRCHTIFSTKRPGIVTHH